MSCSIMLSIWNEVHTSVMLKNQACHQLRHATGKVLQLVHLAARQQPALFKRTLQLLESLDLPEQNLI